MPNQNKTYTATWNAITPTVTFDYNYVGAPQSTLLSQTYDQTYVFTATPTQAGYAFVGWFDAVSGGNLVQSTTIVTQTVAHTLYAHWQANTYSVSFNANYLGAPTEESISQTYHQLYVFQARSLPARVIPSWVGLPRRPPARKSILLAR
jgi:uncharacterized repeat protein (TIGR02543 family)